MSTANQTGLSTFEWIALSDSQIRVRGRDPRLRLCYTGHGSFIRPQWVDSIGKWGGVESADLVSEHEPHNALLHVSISAYRQFKARHHLMTRRQFARHHGPYEWTRAELCFREQARAQRVLGDANGVPHGNAAPIGTACHYAAATARVPLGLLPVEVVLWSALLGRLLAFHGIGFDEWNQLCVGDKRILWQLGDDGAPWGIESALHEPAVVHVMDCSSSAVLAIDG